MDLFEPLTLKITLPEHQLKPTKIAYNFVKRLATPSLVCEVKITQSEHKGLYQLITGLAAPLDVVFIKQWGKPSVIPDNVYCLKFNEDTALAEINADTIFKWHKYPACEKSPNEISDSWVGQFQFKQEIADKGIVGLRKPQIGALHAISASFATDRDIEPVTVVLPTGTGKTETMLSTLLYQQCPKVLVLVPSNSLRDQIGDKFESLGCLSELGVVSDLIAYPYVTRLKKGLRTVEDAVALAESSNVIVATASILTASATNKDVVDALCSRCSHLFIDEAHHISADSWNRIRERFTGRRVVQFTATPFRNDGKNLGGKIIFNYSMGEAQQAGYFKTVELVPVEEYFQERIDNTIASEGIRLLRASLARNLDHLMMARVKSKSRADDLFRLYQRLAPDLNPIVVHSDFSQTKNKECLDLLIARNSRIVICVDMLGEGYDLPNLKIAAIHDHHKSLAITLQFIGRFTRSSSSTQIGNAAVVVNIADPGVEGALQKLYAQGADWDVVLRRLSENRIDREVELQSVVDSLKSKGDLHKQLSLWNLRPSYSAMLFQTDCNSWQPEAFKELLPKCDEFWHSISDDKNILVVLAVQSSPVKWGNFKEVDDINHKILIAHWDEDRSALFIFSNDYKTFKTETLATKLCGDTVAVMSGKQIFNVLNNIEYPLVTNLGSAQIGAISFTQFFGSNVTQGLSSIEKSQSSLSNLAALGYEDGDKVLWGCSERKGKVWSPQSGSVSDWCDWVKSAWNKVVNGEPDESNITRDFLRPERITQNHPFKPVSVQWGEYLQTRPEESVLVYFGERDIPIYLVDLKVSWDEEENVLIKFESDDLSSTYKLSINADIACGYQYELIEGNEIQLKYGNGECKSLDDEMINDPMQVYYVDGSFSYNCFIVKVKNNIGVYKVGDLSPIDWAVNIRKESMGPNNDADTVQSATYEAIKDQFDIVINDDGSGESADLVALKLTDDGIILSLFHCKYSHGDSPGARLNDLYEVCGQAQRSIRWKHVGIPYFYKHIKSREQNWRNRGNSRFLKGDISDLENFKNRSRTTPVIFQVTIVQPGVSVGSVSEEMLKLLGTTELFIKKTTLAGLQVWCSE